MLKDDFKNQIAVKTKEGDFKLLKNNKLEQLVEDDIMIRPDELVKHSPVSVAKINKPVRKKGSNFYFSVEDEDDIKKIEDKSAKPDNEKIKDFIQGKVRMILSQAGLPDQSLKSGQVEKIILSRLKDVRSLAETREALVRLDRGLGGIGFDIDEIVSLIEKYRRQVEEAISSGKIDELAISGPKKDKTDTNNYDFIKDREVGKKKPIKAVTKISLKSKYKKQTDNFGHSAVGPVGEIASLSLSEFRKLGNNPDEAAEWVHEKINLLEDESVLKRADGIRAWKQSQPYRLYLTLGAISMQTKNNIERVIQDQKSKGEEYLTADEFNAIAQLNRKLTY